MATQLATEWDEFQDEPFVPATAVSGSEESPWGEFADDPDAADEWKEFKDEQRPFFSVGDTMSALGDVGRGIVKTTPSAFKSMFAGLTRPDQWSPGTREALDTAADFEQEMQLANLQEGSTSVGNAFREAAGSVGFTIGSMGLAVPAAIGGAKAGAAGGTVLAGPAGTVPGALIGGGAAGALASGAGAYRMAGSRFLYDAFNAYSEQESKRLGRDLSEEEKEEAYQELLPLAQESGLWEAGPEAIGNLATLGAGKVIMGLGKTTLTNMAKTALGKGSIKVGAAGAAAATELATETVTSLGQGLPQAQADAFAAGQDMSTAVSPYDRPGGTMQAFQDVAPATLALSALTMGAAGGANLAMRPFRRPQDAPTVEGVVDPPAEAGRPQGTVEVNGQNLGYDAQALNPDQVRLIAETGSLQDYQDQGMIWDANAPPPGTLPTAPNPAAAPDAAGPAAPAPVGVDPGPTVAEARETLGDTGNVGAAFDPGVQGGPRLAPMPRDAQGGLDLLNFLNDNPIRAPRRNTQAGKAAEYDWREAGDFPSHYRQRIMMEGPANMDDRAQAAFDEGLIEAPTADALAAGVRAAIAKRQNDRRQAQQQAARGSEAENAQVRFERDQQQSQDPSIDLDRLYRGDRLTVNGQQVTVNNVQFDEDGRTTDVDLITEQGLVRVRGRLRGQVAQETATRSEATLEEINAAMQLAAEVPPGGLGNWADGVIEANRGQMNMGVNPVLLVAHAVKAVKAGVKFGKWAADMIRQFGEAVRRYLQGAWNAAKRTSQVGAVDIGQPANTNAALDTDGSVTSMASNSEAAQNTEPSTGGLTESEDYRMQHRPRDDGPRAHDLLEGEVAPRDIYQHPEWYASDPNALEYKETMRQIRAVRGKPNGALTIYRAAPKGAKMRPGDWVSLSKTYAKQHGILDDNPANDMPVISMKVPASHVRWDGNDLNEFGYYPPESSRAEGGATQEVVGKGSIRPGSSKKAIKAFHGTPHKVDKFTTEKIGTGEGAQAFGWGLYFAENKATAQSYQKGLTERDFIRAVREVYSEWDSPESAQEALNDIAPTLSDGQLSLLKALKNEDWWGFDYPHQAVQAALREPDNFDTGPETLAALEKFGNLYEVEILSDEANFLDWDKPLSEQSEKVQEAVTSDRAFSEYVQRIMEKPLASLTGAGAQKMRLGLEADKGSNKPSRDASAWFASLGIPGIRYLDGNSRNGGQGTSNYVVFDEKHVRIKAENGVPVNQETVSWADGVIAESKQQMAMGINPRLMVAYSIKGAQLVQSGVKSFAQWSAAMLKQFGEAVRRYLQGAWQAAKRTSQVGAINLTPAGISARRPGEGDNVRTSQFGERVNKDQRLDAGLRESRAGQFAVQRQQDAASAARQIIAQTSLTSAQARFVGDARLPMPVRIAGMMQVTLGYDAQAALARRQGDNAGSANLDRLVEQAIEAKANLEYLGNEAGRNLAMFNAWARMSPDGQIRRLERQLEQVVEERMEAETGQDPKELDTTVTEAVNNLDVDDILNEVLNDEPGFTPVNTRTGESVMGRILGGAEAVARSIGESATLQNIVRAVDDVLKALSGRLFADPLLLTPMGKAVLTTARSLILQGQKLATAVANAIADVRTRLNDPSINDGALARAVIDAVTKEIVKPIIKRLAFDASYNKREAVTDLLAAGLNMADANKLAQTIISKRPKIQKIAQDKIRQAVMRRLNPSPRVRKKLEQKLPKAIDTMMKAVAGGFAREGAFVRAYQKAYELTTLTPAQAAELRALAAEVNLLPEGVLRQAKAVELLNKMALIKGIPAKDVLLSMWYANILSGLATQGVNIYGNVAGLLRAVAMAGLNLRDQATLVRGMVAGLPAGLREAREAWRTGIAFKSLKWDDSQTAGALDLMLEQGGPQNLAQWVAYIGSVGGLTRYVFRALGAIDAVFWNTAQEGHAHLAVSRALLNSGLRRGTPAFEAAFIQELGGDVATVQADLQTARDELQAAGQPITPSAVNRRAFELRQLRRDRKQTEASKLFADRLVFQQEPEGIGRLVFNLIGLLQKTTLLGVPVFIPLVPFNRILSNLFENAVDFTGVGILRGMLGRHLTDKTRRFGEMERRERVMAGVMGLTAALGVLALVWRYKDEPDETVPLMIYGGGPPDRNRRAQMPLGWRPNTIKVGNQFVSFAETPMGPVLGAVGGVMDHFRYSKQTSKTAWERLSLALAAGVGSFQDLGALSSVKDTLDLVTQDGFINSKWVKQLAMKPVPGFIPANGLMRDVGRVFDDTKISDDDVWGAIVRDVPVLKQTGKAKLNVLGEPLRYEGVPVVNRFVTGQRKDPVWSFLGENRLIIPELPKQIEVGNWLTGSQGKHAKALGLLALENGVMTADQYRTFTIRQGELIRDGVKRMQSVAQAPSPQQTERMQTHLQAVTAAARKRAMLEMVQRLR